MQITSSFGQAAGKAIGDYAAQQMLDAAERYQQASQEAADAQGVLQDFYATPEQRASAQQALDQANAAMTDAKASYSNWEEGGAYRVAAHAIAGGLSGGTGGALGALGSQLTINKVGQYVAASDLPQGVKDALVATAGTAIGALAGGGGSDALAGAATGFNSTVNNYLLHQQVEALKACLTGVTCKTQEEKDKAIKNAEETSKILDEQLNLSCSMAARGVACYDAVSSATAYTGNKDAWGFISDDAKRSSENTFNYIYNAPDAKSNFVFYYDNIDTRANFFGAMNLYEQNIKSGVKWFGGAEQVSRAAWTGLGADGNHSALTFFLGAVGSTHPFIIYDWRSAAGNTLMNGGFDNFKSLYNNGTLNPVAWDINQLKNEQKLLQSIHEQYLSDRGGFTGMSKFITNTDGVPGIVLGWFGIQGQPGGVDLLSYDSRVKFGCRILGYGAAQGCAP